MSDTITSPNSLTVFTPGAGGPVLFPTDFSEQSKGAFEYACELAIRLHEPLIMVHVYDSAPLPEWTPADFAKQMHEEKEKKAKAHFVAYEGIAREKGIIFHTKILSGVAEAAIPALAVSEKAGIIVMGTQGNSSLHETLSGSVTARIMQSVNCPVLAVPSGIHIRPFLHIVYASNFESEDVLVVNQMLRLAALWGSRITCLHVQTGDEAADRQPDATYMADMRKMEPSELRLRFQTIRDTEVSSGLQRFISMENPDLMVMLRHQRSPLERYLSPSNTRRMTLQAHLPLLAFHF